jgi:uncharacterized protein YbaR (Trm112 family)
MFLTRKERGVNYVTIVSDRCPRPLKRTSMRRCLSSSRREVFKFKAIEFDTHVEMGKRKMPLETHPIGHSVPSEVPFNEKLLGTLCCPLTGGDLRLDLELNALVSDRAQLAFPINRAGIPILLTQWAFPWPGNKV